MTHHSQFLFTLSAMFAAACGSSAGPDGITADNIVTLGHVDAPGLLAVTNDCVVVATLGTLSCVPRTGGPTRVIATVSTSPTDSFADVIGDGDGVVVTRVLISGDGAMALRVDRIRVADGAVTALGRSYEPTVGIGAGHVALTDVDVVFSTGGKASLNAIPRTGGSTRRIADDSGNFGDLVAIGSMTYWDNFGGIYRHDAMLPASFTNERVGDAPFGRDTHLATDGQVLVAATVGYNEAQNTTGVSTVLPVAGPVRLVDGVLKDVVVDAGRTYLATSRDVVEIDFATNTTTVLAAGEMPEGLVVADGALVWLTSAGDIRQLAVR